MLPALGRTSSYNGQGQSHVASTIGSMMSALMVLLTITSVTSAYDMQLDNQVYESEHFKRLAALGEIHFDTREPPPRPDLYLHRRQEESSVIDVPSAFESMSTASATTTSSSEPTRTEDSSAASTTSEGAASSSGSSNGTSTATPTSSNGPSVTVITTSLPSPFDTSLGNNFTSDSCPKFFATFLSDSDFRSCLPISLLLQNSNSFFRAERSPSLLASTLDASCSASLAICVPLLSRLAKELVSDSHCGSDYRNENPIVQQAYNGMLAYEPLYRATCLRDPDPETNTYCFAGAVGNASNPADPYPYFSALGLTLPTTAHPSCTPCLQQTMKIFAEYALRKDQPLAESYLGCATQINRECGTGFANETVEVGTLEGTSPDAVNGADNIRLAKSTLLATFVVGIAISIFSL